jgi:hypothetical protein
MEKTLDNGKIFHAEFRSAEKNFAGTALRTWVGALTFPSYLICQLHNKRWFCLMCAH